MKYGLVRIAALSGLALLRHCLAYSTLPLSRRRAGFSLERSPFDDDLPNFLGINPLEAAFVGGVLYYVYGPTTLYEYARSVSAKSYSI